MAQHQLTVLRQKPLISPRPSRSSAMIRNLAARDDRSKENSRNENTYKSKLSTEESFAIAEAQKRAPSSILAENLKLLYVLRLYSLAGYYGLAEFAKVL